MEKLLNYFLLFLNYLEESRNLAYEATAKWADKREIVFNFMNKLESYFTKFHPFTLLIGFLIIFYVMKIMLKKLRNFWRSINTIEKIKISILNFCLRFSFGKNKLEKTKSQLREKVKDSLKIGQFKKLEFRSNGQDVRAILNKFGSLNNSDKETIGGTNTKITGSIYINDSELENLVGETVRMYSYSNLLHPDIFCSARFIESELINIGIELFNGNKDKTCGITTNGGSTSIIYACMAYRNRAYKMGIKKPEMIIPMTAHAAFFKAGEALNIKMVKIPVDSNYQVDIRKVERAINSNTCALAGSTPNFPHGVCDDIEALSNLAVKYKLPLHVDACLGGLLIAFYGAANIKFQKFDFRLPGVTSISADYHKYALCPKGISVLLYADRDYRKHQYFIYPHFMGGLYPSPGFEGSRSPALAAASYAVILHLGKNRYINQAKAIHECVKKIRNWVRDNLKELEVIGNPEVCSVAVKGPKAVLVQDMMSGKGWHLNMINNPFGFMFVVTSANIANVDNGLFFKDLKDCYDKTFESGNEKVSEKTKLYGMSLDLPEAVVRENMDVVCDCMLD